MSGGGARAFYENSGERETRPGASRSFCLHPDTSDISWLFPPQKVRHFILGVRYSGTRVFEALLFFVFCFCKFRKGSCYVI